MKIINKLLGVGVLVTLNILSCKKIDVVSMQSTIIDLGIKSNNTAIKSIHQYNNVITAEFKTTPGSKYSVQFVPFGSEQPIKKEGFTATDTLSTKSYDLAALAKKDYDLIFIDINGKEVKHPILIK